MSDPNEPRYKPFGDRPLEEWDREQLEEMASKQRRDPPKIRKVIDALDSAGTSFVSDLPNDVRDELKRELGLGPFASFGSVARGTRGSKSGNSQSDAKPDDRTPVEDTSGESSDASGDSEKN